MTADLLVSVFIGVRGRPGGDESLRPLANRDEPGFSRAFGTVRRDRRLFRRRHTRGDRWSGCASLAGDLSVRRGGATEIRGASSGIVIVSCALMITTPCNWHRKRHPILRLPYSRSVLSLYSPRHECRPPSSFWGRRASEHCSSCQCNLLSERRRIVRLGQSRPGLPRARRQPEARCSEMPVNSHRNERG